MRRTLSGRLLVLTVLTVVAAEVAIFVPSVARFRLDYLEERLNLGELAAFASVARPEDTGLPEFERSLLARAGVNGVAVRRNGAVPIVLGDRASAPTYDLSRAGPVALVGDAFAALLGESKGLMRVVGPPGPERGRVEILLERAPLREATRRFAIDVLGLSLVIGALTASLVYLLVKRLLVGPMRRVVGSMTAFQRDPQAADAIIRPESRVSEVAEAEAALAAMQTQLREALRERARLADLGEAVAKISHDLRNMLATAHLLAGSVGASEDPVARRVGPGLVSALDRAVRLCERTLRYGRAEEPPPDPRAVDLAALVDEAAEAVLPDAGPSLSFRNETPPELRAFADPDHLFRALANLLRNARHAVELAGRDGAVVVRGRAEGDRVRLEIRDDGPGLPPEALETLFRPFNRAARRGGAGLGLAIAYELTALQGGRLDLLRSSPQGAVFRIDLPAAEPRADPPPISA